MQTVSPQSTATPTQEGKGLGFFERYLSLWVALCTVTLPIVEAGKPPPTEPITWLTHTLNDITLYMHPSLIIPQGTSLRVGVDKCFRWHRLWIDGLESTLA